MSAEYLKVLRTLIDEARVAFRFASEADAEGAPQVCSALERLGGELVYDAQRLISNHRIEVSYLQGGRTGVIDGLDERQPTELLRIWDERNSVHATVQWYQVTEVWPL